MTVARLIKQLTDYPMDAQVCDTDGSPILWMCNRNEGNKVYLEAIADTDIDEELDAFHEEMIECGMSDNDAAQELQDRGFTLDDLRNYSEATYEWAKQTDIDW